MKQRLFALAAAVVMALGLTACGGSGSSEGHTGDTMETYFFDFTVNSAYLTSDYAGHTPAEGNVLLVADITVKNTFQQSIEMYDTDFQVQWDDGDDAYAYPITTDMETYTEVDPVGENQLPGTYSLAVDEERTGELVYEVPSGFADFSIAYLEQFVDDSGEESTGETFFASFPAEAKTGAPPRQKQKKRHRPGGGAFDLRAVVGPGGSSPPASPGRYGSRFRAAGFYRPGGGGFLHGKIVRSAKRLHSASAYHGTGDHGGGVVGPCQARMRFPHQTNVRK